MNHHLLITLPADPQGTVQWLRWDRDAGRRVDGGALSGLEALSELREASRESPAYVIVPGECASHFRVTLPSGGSTAQAALPYRIEEQLCSDLAALHITSEKIVANEPVSAVAVEHALMRQWTDALQRAGLRVRAMLPDFMLLTTDTVVVEPERVIACRGEHRAALDRETLPQWWSLIEGGETGEVTAVAAGSDVADWLPEKHRIVNAASALEGIARCMGAATLNLLHGPYRLRDPMRENVQLWRRPAIAVAVVLLAHWAVLGVETLRFEREQAALDRAIEQVYRETFPAAQRIVNPRSQMRSQLMALEQTGQSGPLLPWLEHAALALKDRNDVQVKQLHYQQRPQSLRLSVNAPDYAAIDRLTQAIASRNVAVERGTFSQQGKVIDGQILIRGEG